MTPADLIDPVITALCVLAMLGFVLWRTRKERR